MVVCDRCKTRGPKYKFDGGELVGLIGNNRIISSSYLLCSKCADVLESWLKNEFLTKEGESK